MTQTTIQTAQSIAEELLKVTNPISFLETISLTKEESKQKNQISFWKKLESTLRSLLPESFVQTTDDQMVQILESQYERLCDSLDTSVDPALLRTAAQIAAQCNIEAMTILQQLEQ